MSRFLFRPQALDDLRELPTQIARDRPYAAEGMHDQIIETCKVLADNPLIATELKGLPMTGIRRIPVVKYPRYSIFCQVIGDRIEIVRLGFGGRDWGKFPLIRCPRSSTRRITPLNFRQTAHPQNVILPESECIDRPVTLE